MSDFFQQAKDKLTGDTNVANEHLKKLADKYPVNTEEQEQARARNEQAYQSLKQHKQQKWNSLAYICVSSQPIRCYSSSIKVSQPACHGETPRPCNTYIAVVIVVWVRGLWAIQWAMQAVSARRGVIGALMATVRAPIYVQRAVMDVRKVLEMVGRFVELLLHARRNVVDPVVDYGLALAVVVRPVVRVVVPLGAFVVSRILVVTGRVIGLWIGTAKVVGKTVMESMGVLGEKVSEVESSSRGFVVESSVVLVGIAVRTTIWLIGTVIGVYLFLARYMLAAR